MIARRRATAIGIGSAAIALAFLGIEIGTASPTRDLSIELPGDSLVLAGPGPATASGVALEGTDRERVLAYLDEQPVGLAWQGPSFQAALPQTTPGSHLLRMGVRHRGPIDRMLTLPVVTGPFANRGEWIESGFEIFVAMSAIDDGDVSTTLDLSAALSEAALANARPAPNVGRLRRLPIRIEPGGGSRFLITGTAIFDRGSVSFEIPLAFRRRTPTQLALVRAGSRCRSARDSWCVRATADGDILRVGRDIGSDRGAGFGAILGGAAGCFVCPLCCLFGAVAGAAAGSEMGSERGEAAAREAAQRGVEDIVDRYLPRLSRSLAIPARIPLGDPMPGCSLELRFGGAPLWQGAAGLRFPIDTRVARDAGSRPSALPGPLQFQSVSTPFDGDGFSHVRVSPRLVAELADAYTNEGHFDRDLNARLDAEQQGNEPLHVDGVTLRMPGLAEAGQAGALRWSVPDAAVTLSNQEGRLGLDVRAFLAGTLIAQLAPDGRSVEAAIRVSRIGVSCRERTPTGFHAHPCLSDAMALVPDAPRALTRRIPKLRLFESMLGALVDARFAAEGSVQLQVVPQALRVGTSIGEPGVDLAVRAEFLTPRSSPAAPAPAPVGVRDVTSEVLAQATASSFIGGASRTHGPEKAFDGRPETAWNEAAPGPGVGEWIDARFRRPVRVAYLTITPGWNAMSRQGIDLFTANRYMTSFDVEFDGGRRSFRVPEGTRVVRAEIGSPTTRVRIVARSVQPGAARWDDLCISEVRVFEQQ